MMYKTVMLFIYTLLHPAIMTAFDIFGNRLMQIWKCSNVILFFVHRFCPNDEWTLPKSFNCTNNDCPVVEAILDYSKDNLVMFNIFIKEKYLFKIGGKCWLLYFQDPYAKRFMKDEKITKTAYIANSGGLLGLCMGFSLVSAAEILYHCLFGLFSPICGRGKKNNKVFIVWFLIQTLTFIIY